MVNARSMGAQLHWDLPRERYDPAPEDAAAGAGPVQDDMERVVDVLDEGAEAAPQRDDLAPRRHDPPPSVDPAPRQDDPAVAAQPRSGDVMTDLKACFQPGGRISFHVVRRGGDTWSGNGVIDQVVDEVDKRGRYLAITTTNFQRGGQAHYVSLVIRNGELTYVGLMAKEGGSWKRVAPQVFSARIRKGSSHADFEGGQAVALTAEGQANQRRGVARRVPASFTVRSYHVAGAGDLQY
jgi:hypothetical protein